MRKLNTWKCLTKRLSAKQMWLYLLQNRLPKMPKMPDEKVALKKIVQICTNFGTLSMHVILLSVSARILINASFFVRLFLT